MCALSRIAIWSQPGVSPVPIKGSRFLRVSNGEYGSLAALCRDSSHERGLRRVLSNVSPHVGFIFSRSSCARRVRVLDDDKAAT